MLSMRYLQFSLPLDGASVIIGSFTRIESVSVICEGVLLDLPPQLVDELYLTGSVLEFHRRSETFVVWDSIPIG